MGRTLLCLCLLLAACPSGPEPNACADGEVLDERDACVPSACGTTVWPPFDGDGVRVSPDGSGSGDGSADAPFDRIRDAVDEANSRGADAVLIAGGTYEEQIVLDSDTEDLAVVGRCAEMVRIDAPGPVAPTEGVVLLDGRDLLLAGVTVRARQTAGVVAGSVGQAQGVNVDDVVIDGATYAGLAMFNGSGRVRNVIIDAVRPDAGISAGLWVALGGDWTADNVTVTDFEGIAALLAEGIGSNLVASGVTVDGGTGIVALGGYNRGALTLTDAEVTNYAGTGVLAINDGVVEGENVRVVGGDVNVAADGGVATFSNSTFEDPTGIGVLVSNGGSAILTGGTVRLTEGAATPIGAALSSAAGSSVSGVGLTVEGAFSVAAHTDGGSLTFVDSTLRGARQRPGAGGMQELGVGITAASGEVSLTRTTIEDCAGYGLLATERSVVTVDTVTVAGPSRIGGVGLIDADMTGTGLTIRDTSASGLALGTLCADPSNCDQQASVTLAGLFVENITTSDFGQPGIAALVQTGGTMTLDAPTISGCQVGGHAQNGGALVLEGGSVLNGVQDAQGRYGYGLTASGGTVSGSAVVLGALFDVAAYAYNDGAISLTDPGIEGVAAGGASGTAQGVAALSGGSVTVAGGTITSTVGPGSLAFDGGAISLTDVEISEAQFAGAASYEGGTTTLNGGRILDVTPSARDGGGVGAFARSGSSSASLILQNVLLGPVDEACVYVIGLGRYEVEGGTLQSCGGGPASAAVLAAAGVGVWDSTAETGLRVDGAAFGPLSGDAVLLDGSGGTFANNVLTDVDGVAMWRQRCDGAPSPVVDDPAMDVPCEETARVVEPFLSYAADLTEVDVDP